MKTDLSSNRHIALVMAKILVLLLMISVITFVTGVTRYDRLMAEKPIDTVMDPESSIKVSGPHRKLLLLHQEVAKVQPNRIWGDKCSKSDIIINQGPTSPLPSGIPMYTVEIVNMCTSGCDISNIHLSCGWFSSARLVNPHLFKRLDYNDCLVNNGKPLVNGRTISFQYANTFPYPLSISSIMC